MSRGLINALKQPVYRVRSVTCPKCGVRIDSFKPKNRTSLHEHRMRVLGQHYREAHA